VLPTTGLPLPTSTILPTSSTTILPTLSVPPLPTLTLAPAAAEAASPDVVLAALGSGTVRQRIDLPVLNDATGDVRGVRAKAIGAVEDTSSPAMTFFGGEVEVRVGSPATLTAYADGVHPGVVDWVPANVTVSVGGTRYALPPSGNPVVVPYSDNKDLTLTLSAGRLEDKVENPNGFAASGRAAVMDMVVKYGDTVVLQGEFMPMSVAATSPTGGLECPAPDADGDGLSDALENKIGTDKAVKDTDHDGLTDGQEYFKYKTKPLKPDTDKDGLEDGAEVKRWKTKPLKADSDKDKLSDGLEVKKYKTKPLKADTDRDKLPDGLEVKKYKTNPRKKDTDHDGVSDGVEVRRGTNPRHK
jgi:hypothetical protein